jgi:DNA mismatch endonuclease (patch repair protein)
MPDTRTPEQRRRIMQSVKTKDTTPEWAVRRLLHRLGYRYRLHVRELPGKPDMVFPGRKKIVFVHGCYWHGHGCKIGRLPKSRLDYWEPKIEANKARDAARQAELEALGWSVLTVWQCETKHLAELEGRLRQFLDADSSPDRQMRVDRVDS